MKGIMLLELLFYFIFIGATCHNGYQTILLENNYTDSIYVTTASGFKNNYPDTILPIQKTLAVLTNNILLESLPKFIF